MWLQDTIEYLVGYPVEWSDTAAWVQAIFSVVAIGAAVLVDRGSSRRAEAARAADAAQREADRLAALEYVLLVVQRMAEHGEAPPDDPVIDGERVVRAFRRLDRAIRAVEIYQKAEAAPLMLLTLLVVADTASRLRTNLGPVVMLTPRHFTDYLGDIYAARAAISAALNDLRDGHF